MARHVRIAEIEFFAGTKPQANPLTIKPGAVTVFVGPNNSGKSLALLDIERWCHGGEVTGKVVKEIVLDYPRDSDVARQLLEQVKASPPVGFDQLPNQLYVRVATMYATELWQTAVVNLSALPDLLGEQRNRDFRQMFIRPFTIRLDGRTRLVLSEAQPTGDLLALPQNHLAALAMNDAARERVRELIYDAFGMYFVVDPTEIQRFRIRMSRRPPSTSREEQSWDETARKFHGEATPIDQFGDGVKCFVGLIAAVFSLPHQIMLIDEPEAFLHPPLARRLARNLSGIAREREASLVTATHSADFLMGCIEESADTTVVRLTFEAGVATARTLPSTELATLMHHPLLRSTGVLGALFHRAAVVTEADSDRALYEEINRRLLAAGRGIEDAIFLNAHEKQTVQNIVGPLRQLGIPTVAIVDLDIMKDNDGTWEKLLDACQVPQGRWLYLMKERADVLSALLAAQHGGVIPIKRGGIPSLNPAMKTRAEQLLHELATYGLFVVPRGEMEAWLSQYSISGHGPKWLVDLFGRIGQVESDPNYLHPGSDDVWIFIDQIAAWISDSRRLGVS